MSSFTSIVPVLPRVVTLAKPQTKKGKKRRVEEERELIVTTERHKKKRKNKDKGNST